MVKGKFPDVIERRKTEKEMLMNVKELILRELNVKLYFSEGHDMYLFYLEPYKNRLVRLFLGGDTVTFHISCWRNKIDIAVFRKEYLELVHKIGEMIEKTLNIPVTITKHSSYILYAFFKSAIQQSRW